MRRTKVNLLLISLLIVLAVCLFSLPTAFSYADTTETEEVTYTYTKQVDRYVNEEDNNRVVMNTHYYIDDIEGGYGELVKSFNYPSSFNVQANVKSSIIYDAMWQIVEADSVDVSEYYVFTSQTVLTVFDVEQSFQNHVYRYNEILEEPDLNLTMDHKTLSANGEYEVTGEYILSHNQPYTHYYFHFNISPITMTPIEEGSLINLTSYYFYTPDSDSGVQERTTINTHANGEIFSTDPNSSGYIVGAIGENGLPSTNYTMSFIYDGKAEIEGEDYYLYISELRDEPYTVQGKLSFKTYDGEEHTIFTNIITVRKHTLEMRIDSTDDYRVGVGIEHEYSFILDKNNLTDFEISSSGLYFVEDTSTSIDKSLKVKYAYGAVGESKIRFSLIITFNGGYEQVNFQRMAYDVSVLAEEPVRIVPDYEIKFSLPETAYAVFGGSEFEVSASINDFYGDEHFVTEISLSGVSLAVLSSTSNTLLLVPLSVGRSAVRFTAISQTAGEFSASIIVDVLESTAENTAIVFDEEFNLTGSNVVARLSIGGVTEFINYTPTWNVKIESGESYVDVPFSVDDSLAAVLENAQSGYYQFSVSGTALASVDTIKRVSDINMAEVAEKILPYLALVMVLFIIIVIILHFRAKKNRTLLKRLQKTQAIIDSALKEKVSRAAFNRLLNNLIKSMKRSHTEADTRDLETLGLYQNICNNLKKSIQICEAAKLNSGKMGKVLTTKFMKNLKKHYINEAVRMCIEIDESLAKFAKVKAVAVTVAPDEKRSPSEEVKYKAMLNKFYHQGDDVDSNGRSGDDDRDDDSKSE